MGYSLDIPSLELSNLLAEKYGVMLAPGSAFGIEHHLRLGIGQEPGIFSEGLRRTAACLAELETRGVARRETANAPA
jgi:aspartate/methionine/tyrosine aminotransferase